MPTTTGSDGESYYRLCILHRRDADGYSTHAYAPGTREGLIEAADATLMARSGCKGDIVSSPDVTPTADSQALAAVFGRRSRNLDRTSKNRSQGVRSNVWYILFEEGWATVGRVAFDPNEEGFRASSAELGRVALRCTRTVNASL